MDTEMVELLPASIPIYETTFFFVGLDIHAHRCL